MTDQPLPPPVMWAQRSSIVFLTINLEDVKNPEIKFNKDSIYFKGTGGVEKKDYEVTIPLYKEIDPEQSKSFNKGRCIEIIVTKANTDGPYWPTLTSDKKKHHWLKCDFNKWHDEDDSGDEGVGGMGGGDFDEMMRQMGGLGGGAGKPNFDDIEGDEVGDSDDEPIPELE
ncbi:co-chaperone protein daf-41 [Diabrotica virgifera virgifera]|uniref:Co-chaperone protein daf-41-like n=2 Tax=Diabrotica virgifera virgifera TaxID=50390 RepID=A0A6P7HFL1_DIAVI|nr:co-chaperone protein daf-41 [Diabrotica virgifera virgifera]